MAMKVKILKWTLGHADGVSLRHYRPNETYEVPPNIANYLVAEGAAKELDRFIDDVKQKMGQFIRRADVQDSPGTAEFSDFSIRP